MITKNKYEKEKLGEIIKLVKMSSCGVLATDEGIIYIVVRQNF